MNAKALRTVRQLADELPAFDESALRRLIFQAEAIDLDHAIVRIGRRVLIDREAFGRWLDTRRGLPPHTRLEAPPPATTRP